VAVLAALAVLAFWPVAGASATVISSPGPFTSIFVEEDLGCQAQASGDAGASFFPGSAPGACGTFLALTAGEGVTGGIHLFGSSPPADGFPPEADFKPVGPQTLKGKGTEAEPFVVTTHAGAFEKVGPEEEEISDVAEVTETDSYVTGRDSYNTTITVVNHGGTRLEGTLYHAGDCLLAGVDTGFGAANVPTAGSVACTIAPNDSPPARYMAFSPLTISGGALAASFLESNYSTVWSNVNAQATLFPNKVDATTNQDNGMGLSWPIKVGTGAENTATVSFSTTVSPSSAPTSSTSAGACVPSGQVPVTVSAVNGNRAVDYVLDGVPGSAPTNEAGQATISMAPGQHTLEFWGEDLTGAQESPHHVVSVTVAAGGPSLTITSDQSRSNYEVGEAGSVTITATGPGLTSNPSAANVPISTTTPGTFSMARSAADACGTTNASFTYTVLPRPVLGKTVNVEVVSGKVFVALPAGAHLSLAAPLDAAVESLSKGLHFVPITEASQIPVGSTLETTAGIARVTTATSTIGKTQEGEFGAGIFKLLQSHKQRGLTELNIVDNHSAKQVCASVGKKASAAKLSSKVLGRLNSNAHGKFTTRGQYSAATVRGTAWNVTNQCNGTLTKVTRGVVSVRDFRRRKTVTVFAGQSYLAKAP
jgi:hypothetical protein